MVPPPVMQESVASEPREFHLIFLNLLNPFFSTSSITCAILLQASKLSESGERDREREEEERGKDFPFFFAVAPLCFFRGSYHRVFFPLLSRPARGSFFSFLPLHDAISERISEMSRHSRDLRAAVVFFAEILLAKFKAIFPGKSNVSWEKMRQAENTAFSSKNFFLKCGVCEDSSLKRL